MRNSLSTINRLIAAANRYRAHIINGMMNAAAEGKPVDFAPLSVNASRPIALGFSVHDLDHFMNIMSDRHFRFCLAAADLERRVSIGMSKLAQVNVKATRNGGHMTRQESDEKKNIIRRLSILSAQAKVEEAYAEACVIVMRALQLELFYRVVTSDTPKVEPAKVKTVAVITPTVIKPIVIKKKPKGIKKAPQCRGEIILHGFDALKEYQENTAIFSEYYGK